MAAEAQRASRDISRRRDCQTMGLAARCRGGDRDVDPSVQCHEVGGPVAMLNDPASTEYYFDKGMEHARVGDVDTAAELFRQASDRGHALAASLLAALLKDRGLLAEAEMHYRRALASGLPPDEHQLIAEC